MDPKYRLPYCLILIITPSKVLFALRCTFLPTFRSKKLWLDGFLKLHSVLTVKELSDLQEVMREKELNLRTDIYEILLQDEMDG